MSDLGAVLDRTRAFLVRFVVFASAAQADAAALWVGHTWLYDQFDTTPYLAVQSPAKRSGKSRLLEVLSLLVRQPQPSGGASLAALFRIIDKEHPTLLLDEADTIFNRRHSDSTEDVRGLLNNGYRRGVPYLRVVGDGKKMRVERFDVFCPKAIASIGRLPDTAQDRAVVLALKRRSLSERVEKFRFRRAELDALPLREWWESLADSVTLPEDPSTPESLGDRAADSWEPLMALAEAAGGEWPKKAATAAVLLSGADDPEDENLSVQVLSDIRDILREHGEQRIATTTLVDKLQALAERPWAEDYRHGRPLKAEGLAYLLRPYNLRSRQLKVGGANVRGYDVAWFADAFDRYLPPLPHTASARYPATPERESEREGSGVAGQTRMQEGPAEALRNGAAVPARPNRQPQLIRPRPVPPDPDSVEGRYLRSVGELDA